MTYLPSATPLTPLSAIREWEQLMRQIGALAEAAVDATARPDRIWQQNGLEALITATEPGATVADSGYTRESALAARAFVLAFMSWALQPITIGMLPDGETPIQLTPLQIISKR